MRQRVSCWMAMVILAGAAVAAQQPPPRDPKPKPGEPARPSEAKPASAASLEELMTRLHAEAAANPENAEAQYRLAVHYEEAVRKGNLPADRKAAYVAQGLQAADRALTLQPDYMESMVYKNLLLRQQALLEPDPEAQKALLAQADALREKAIAVNKERAAKRAEEAKTQEASGCRLETPDGSAPVRVGGTIKPPVRTRQAVPDYPPDALAAGVGGVVILEILIDRDGLVSQACVLRSIPQLDAAALATVRQWEYEPTWLNGVAVPVIMTATVNFQPR